MAKMSNGWGDRKSDAGMLSLEQMLERLTVAEIRRNLNGLSLRCKSGVRKVILVKGATLWILEHPKEVIRNLFLHELRLYDDMIHRPEDVKGIDVLNMPCMLPFTDSLIMPDWRMQYYLAPDLAESLRPHIADAIAEREESGEADAERHLLGLLNLQGTIEFDQFMNMLSESGLDEEKQDSLYERFKRLVATDEETGVKLLSPFMLDSKFNPFDENQMIPGYEPKDFGEQEIQAAAEMPYPRIGGSAYDALERYLHKGTRTNYEIQEALFRCWRDKQLDGRNPIKALTDLEFTTVEEIQEAMPLVMEYLNSVPFWKFHGWSSLEARQRKQHELRGGMPRIEVGPGIRASWEQLKEMGLRSEAIPFSNAPGGKKPGRNDPCPCGSGKKYKQCCGKN